MALRQVSTCCQLFLAFTFLVISCGKPDQPNPDPSDLNDSKEIISFNLKRNDGTAFTASEISFDFNGTSIQIIVPANTDCSALIPEIKISGITILPASGTVKDFTHPVTYTVKAEDGTTQEYIVTIKPDKSGRTVFMGTSDNEFLALNAETGKLKWRFQGTASFAYSGATFANETIFVGSIDGYVYAFNAQNGNLKWKYFTHAHGIESDAVVVNGIVYVGSNDDNLYALKASDGQLIWKFATAGNISASPTIHNNIVYFGSSDSKLYAVDAFNGSLKWSFATSDMINQSGPAFKDGVVYVGSRDGYLYAVNASDGSLKWKYNTGGFSLEQSSATVTDELVYIGNWGRGGLFAVDINTGNLAWEKLKGIAISSSPTVSNGRVFITADDFNIYSLDAASGETIWQKSIIANSASPAVSINTVFVGGGGTWNIYALDVTSGHERWQYPIKGLSTSCPLIVDVNGSTDYSGDSGALD